MIPPDRLIRDIEHADRFSEFMKLRNYIVENARDYTEESYDVIRNTWREKFNEHFDPVGCNNIEKFYLYYGSTTKFKLDRAVGMCHDAKEEGVPFIEYVQRLYPDATDAQSIVYSAGERETTLAKSVFQKPRYTATTPGENTVSMNPYSVGIERLKDQIEVLENTISDLTKKLTNPITDERIAKLESSMNALSTILNQRLNEQKLEEIEPNRRSLTVVLTSAQYAAFVRTIPRHAINNKVERTGRGQYTVTFTFEPEQRQTVENYIKELMEVETPQGSRVVNPPQYDEVLHLLCQNYSQATGLPCNSFNQGALKTLARRVADLLNGYGLQYDTNGIDLASVDLFAKKGEHPYTAEHAGEAFTQIRNRILALSIRGEVTEPENEGEGKCDPMVLAADYARYRAIAKYANDLIMVDEDLPDEYSKELNSLEKHFYNCGYGTNSYDLLEQLASDEFGHLGLSLDGEIEREYNRILGVK
jgi:hypothetical protein